MHSRKKEFGDVLNFPEFSNFLNEMSAYIFHRTKNSASVFYHTKNKVRSLRVDRHSI